MIRPEHLCQKRECPRAATVAIRVCVPAVGAPDETAAASVLMGVRVCDEHLAEDDPQGWVTGHAGAQLRPVLMMATGVKLDFPRAWTEGVPVNSSEVQSLLARPAVN